ncbi:MAG: DUF3854 domain-containing protein [Leptolyngbyaceae cyanobacterium SL_7_1]|nr:DUF3854 domain-containing protein [Leptolyngbyaceae cyanobacterium SL_7_1]
MSSLPRSNQRCPSQADFTANIEREFLQGSAIAPPLYQVATAIVGDTQVEAGGDVAYPIHEALNWHVTRFGRQTRQILHAVLLLNEDHTCWQAKLSTPRQDKRKGTVQKYETPVGNGSKPFLPAVPPQIRQRIAHRYGVDIPNRGSFWNWYAGQSALSIPLILTEGGKKALSLFSQGYVAIALYGVNGGYRNHNGLRELIPELGRFLQPGRSITLAFDQDEKTATRRRVAVALLRFGNLLTAAGAEVRVAQWQGRQGKGVDDLIVESGIAAWEQADADALSLDHWQLWQRLENRLSYPAHLALTSTDLSTLQLPDLPPQGIIGIASAKGTGKTKFIATLLKESDRAIATGHRIALMRNLCQRLGLDYRGDLDKVRGEFITGAAYTLRIGLCVDSVLAIDPQRFIGCDLVLDEAVQVIRHLLSSSTCARDGKRPALLARFKELVQHARRVIVADADLNNATIDYLKTLRDEDASLFLIRNHYKPKGYPVRFIDAPDRSCILDELVIDISTQAANKVIYIATDSKGTSKAIAHLIQQHYPDKRVLLINSETSGGECEQAFMQTPDAELSAGHYDIVICSPSVATGVSIEVEDKVERVYGIFMGNSSTDEDMAQALGRVRQPVERIVWCAKMGTNFSTVSRSTNSLDLKRHLYEQTSVTVSLIRSSLKQDTYKGVEGYDWQTDPHLNLYCQIAASQNYVMHRLRDALLIRLRYEGNLVEVETRATNTATKQVLSAIRLEIQELEAEKLVTTEDLTYAEVLHLEQQESVSPDAATAIAKFYLKDFYGWETLTTAEVHWDNNGLRRGEILNLEDLLFPGLAIDRAVKSLEKQVRWGQHLCPWDISHAPLRRRLRQELGLDQLLQRLRTGWNYTRYDLAPYAVKARAMAPAIKVALHLTITTKMSDVQIVHQLLAQMGVKVQQLRWSRAVANHEGEKLRVYGLDIEHWRKVWKILERRHQRRQQLQQISEGVGSPPHLEFKRLVGDPANELAEVAQEWFTAEAVADAKSLWAAMGTSPTSIRLGDLPIPVPLLRYIGLFA